MRNASCPSVNTASKSGFMHGQGHRPRLSFIAPRFDLLSVTFSNTCLLLLIVIKLP